MARQLADAAPSAAPAVPRNMAHSPQGSVKGRFACTLTRHLQLLLADPAGR